VSLSLILEMASAGSPDKVVIGTRDRGITAAALARQAVGGAQLLRAADAGSVAFLGVSSGAFPSVLFASAAAGLPFTPLNYRLTADQIADLVRRLDRPVLVVDHAYRTDAESLGFPVLATETWTAAAQAAESGRPVDLAQDAPAVVLYTSGTTAAPKGAILRHSNLLSYVMQTVEFASAPAESAILVSVPPYHVAGVGTVLTNLYAGRRIVYLPNFTASGWLELAGSEAITHAMVVPTMLARIVEELGGQPAGLPSLQAIAYGGARMPRPVLEAALECFPQVDFTNAYGLTETSSTIAVLGPDDHRAALQSNDPKIRARLGSVGRLVPGVEAEIRGEDGQALARGEVGELWVRGPQVSGEYVGSPAALDRHGWFHTRDLARIDDGGFVHITGRSDDTIIKGGENIAPAEIEEVLIRHPQVKDVAVVGAADEEWGARIVAVVVAEADPPPTARDLKEWTRSRLRGSRTPDEVRFVVELPYTPTGKLLRRQLIESLNAPVVADKSPS
jgi:acyl-CoA synthetase (AMP-forming)/AMP-acid ligase II